MTYSPVLLGHRARAASSFVFTQWFFWQMSFKFSLFCE